MRFVAIETSTTRGGLALFDGGALRQEVFFPEGLIHGREITARLEDLLRGAGWKARSLEGIAVSVGPGSYTGIRVGVTAAKTLASCLRLPLVAESSLRVLAGGCLLRPDGGPTARCIAALDGRQGFTFWAAFERREGEIERLTPDVVSAGADLEGGSEGPLRALDRESAVCVVGAGADAFLRSVGAPAWARGEPALDAPVAAVLGRLAWPALREATFDAGFVHRLEPAYLRATEAERKLGLGQGR
jgi:tRNA threonylcarbamoyladenosine biosynthesis protein TsaB